MKKRKGRRTTIERLGELREELEMEKKKKKKRKNKPFSIDVQKVSKKKRKQLEKKLNPALLPYYNSFSSEKKKDFWAYYEKFENVYDFEEVAERERRLRENRIKKEKYIEQKLRDIEGDDIDDLIKIDKILHESYNKKRFRHFKKFGYEIGEDDIIYVNEDKLIDGLKRRRKELREVNRTFKDYLESVMGEDNKYIRRIEESERKVNKNVKDLLKSFEVVAIESSVFRLK